MPWFICCVLGGILTGYIGVAIEKVLFMLITLNPAVDIRAATVTSITVVGWLAAFAFLMHAMSHLAIQMRHSTSAPCPNTIGWRPLGDHFESFQWDSTSGKVTIPI